MSTTTIGARARAYAAAALFALSIPLAVGIGTTVRNVVSDAAHTIDISTSTEENGR